MIVLDAAPTGETLTLLTLPQVTQWWLQKAFPLQKTAIKTVGFAVRKTTGIPLDKGYEELDWLFGKLGEIQTVLQDPQVSSARLVMNPERMVIQEAKRAYTYLQLYGYGVDAAVVNRVWPADAGPMMQPYVDAQAGYLQEIDDAFAPMPVLTVPHLGREVFGLDLLARIADALYGDPDAADARDPAAVYHTEPGYRVTPVAGRDGGGAYDVAIRVPHADAADVDARHAGDELVVQIANQRRNVALPAFLAYYRLAGATVDGGWLTARFESGDAG